MYKYIVEFYDYNDFVWKSMDSFITLYDAETYISNEKDFDRCHKLHFKYRILKVVEIYV